MSTPDVRSLLHRRVPEARGRKKAYRLSRTMVVVQLVLFYVSFIVTPSGAVSLVLDVLLRTYLMFVGCVMAHEAVHGHLGSNKRSNFLWGRLALLPSMVPFTNFRKTHRLHHSHTNIPGHDPDLFIKPSHAFEIPFRALAMPHQWFFWLRRRGLMTSGDVREIALNYAAIMGSYATLLCFVDARVLILRMLPALVLVSLLLWYTFALKTHEGFSTGAAETRSHDYYGPWMYWFSLGLSLHRVHHLRPGLNWLELRCHVKRGSGRSLIPRRDIVRSSKSEVRRCGG